MFSGAIFTLSVLFAIGIFAYKYYLNYRITQMGEQIEAARASLDPETVTELIRLSSRLESTKTLIDKHRIISPVFDLLEKGTPATVAYNDFNFTMGLNAFEMTLHGMAKSYADLASAAEYYNKSGSYFKNVSFSDLQLDTTGNVTFMVKMEIDPNLLSYNRFITQTDVAPIQTGPATSTRATAATSTSAGPR